MRVDIDPSIRDGAGVASNLPTTYLPLIDETATGNVTAITDVNGNLVERVLYADAYGDAPRSMRGAAVEHVTFEGTKDASGNVTSVVVKLRLSDDMYPSTVSSGVRLAATDASNNVVATSSVTPQLTADNELTWTLQGSEWASLNSASGAANLEAAVRNTLRTTTWGDTPVVPAPDWALQLYSGVVTSSATPFAVRASFASLQTYIDTASTDPRVLYDLPDLYLAGSRDSKVKLLTGFKAAPFTDPATGMSYFRARWYDPATGAWLTPDQVGYRDSSTLYAYCGGEPVGCRDPLGASAISSAFETATRDTMIGTAVGYAAGLASRVPKLGGSAVTGAGIGWLANRTLTAWADRIEQLSSRGDYDRWHAFQYAAGDVTGLTAITEAITGDDVVTGETLSDDARGARIGSATGIVGGAVGGGLAYGRGYASQLRRWTGRRGRFGM